MPQSATAGSQGSFTSSFLRICQAGCQSSCTVFSPTSKTVVLPPLLALLADGSLVIVFILAFLIGASGISFVVLICVSPVANDHGHFHVLTCSLYILCSEDLLISFTHILTGLVFR